jgi:hypothetical protein
MNTKLFPLKTLALAALLFSAAAAQAEITIFTSQSSFLSAVKAPGVDTYDDLTVMSYPQLLSRSAGVYDYTVETESNLYGAGGGTDHWLSTNAVGEPMIFTGFAGKVTAFGGNFFGSDIAGQFLPGTSVMLTAFDGTSATYQLDNTTTGSFLGFTSTSPLVRVTLSSVGNYWPTANNVTLGIAAPVPEPETYAMLLGGLMLLGGAARRRR